MPRGRLVIPSDVLGDLLHEAARTWPLETGGVLLGADDEREQVVRCLIGPGPAAVHERRSFTPDDRWQAKAVAAAWHADPSLRYLGDWHSHPGGAPVLSQEDKRALCVIASFGEAQQPRPVMLVVAMGRDARVRLGAGRWTGGRTRPAHVLLTASQL